MSGLSKIPAALCEHFHIFSGRLLTGVCWLQHVCYWTRAAFDFFDFKAFFKVFIPKSMQFNYCIFKVMVKVTEQCWCGEKIKMLFVSLRQDVNPAFWHESWMGYNHFNFKTLTFLPSYVPDTWLPVLALDIGIGCKSCCRIIQCECNFLEDLVGQTELSFQNLDIKNQHQDRSPLKVSRQNSKLQPFLSLIIHADHFF